MKIRVGVLRGGPSHEYEVSLKSGATVLNNLNSDKFEGVDIFIDKQGVWHIDGLVVKPENALKRIDVAFIALHGEYGEDGQIQKILEHHNIPFTGSDSFSSAIGMNKALSKDAYKKRGIQSPYHKLIKADDKDIKKDNLHNLAMQIFKTVHLPFVIKPVSAGSSVGVFIVNDFEGIEVALKKAFEVSDDLMIEEYIKGIEATCGVIENFRDQKLYALPPVEIRPIGKDFFDYEAKYEGKSEEICPANFSHDIKEEIMRLSKLAHEALGLNHYSRSDFIIHPKRGIFILETNTLPGLTEASLLPKALHAVGGKLEHFIDHLITLAINRKKG